jgi:N-acetylmuramoyl-L-alanine amidase
MLVGVGIDYMWNKKNKTPIEEYDNIVIHYTAGASAISSVNYLNNPNTPVSAHLLIARNGHIYQMVDFETQAWHAGKSKIYNKTNLNNCSVGIELENFGLLTHNAGDYYTWFGKKVPKEQVVQLINPQTGFNACWHKYTDIQINITKKVCLLLMNEYRYRRIVGHNEISLSGKIDPGPAFPLEELKTEIFNQS